MLIKFRLLAFFLLLTTVTYSQQYSLKEHVELGGVNWLRNHDDAIKMADQNEKSILILFQEVPGCSTCRNYGQNVLTHPLIIEAIETYFVPLCVFNNTGGQDRVTLKLFSEPTWNNPVVRIVDTRDKNIVPRIGNDYSASSLVNSICLAIINQGNLVPPFLQLLEEELSSSQTKEAYLSMYCFWTGEKSIGQIDGVISTEAGFMNGREVVKTTYNPSVVNLKTIEDKAKKSGCADQVFTEENNYRPDKEIKYYLQHSPYKSIPMTDIQAMKVNSDLGNGVVPDEWLSPRQLSLLNEPALVKKNFIGQDIIKAWNDVQ